MPNTVNRHHRTASWLCTGTLVSALGAAAIPQDGDQPPPTRDADRVTDQDPNRRDQELRRRRARDAQPRDQLQIPADIQFVPDVIYDTAPADDGSPVELLMDVAFLKVAGDDPLPVIVYIHGGGFRGGSREHGRGFTIAAAQGGYFGVTIDYRLSGQAKFPAAVHDCRNAIRFLRANAVELGIDPERIGVWGHSAGGHLSAFIATSGNDELMGAAAEKHDDTEGEPVSSSVACAVDVSGPTDFVRLVAAPPPGVIELMEYWFGKPGVSDEALLNSASPLQYLDANDPPLMIVHGTSDEVVPFEQAELLRDAAAKLDMTMEFIPVEEAGHNIRDPREVRRIAAFFDQHLGGAMADAIAPRRRNRPTDPARDGG